MVKIALITEGVTDQFIIKPIIENYFKDTEFRFTPVQPPVDETDKQTNFGSWVNVLNVCKSNDVEDLFNYNDFVVIQIDADISQEKGFDVPHLKKGKQIENEELCKNVINKLQSFIPKEVWNKYSDRFLFSIGILSMECWIVPIVDSKHNKNSVNNCIKRLNISLAKKDIKTINPNDKNNFQSRTTYKKLAREFKNKKIIVKFAKYNVGFECFIGQLENIK
ncbi:MAG: hypothetical protein ABFS35_14610 [Bacteroidota bacterium]